MDLCCLYSFLIKAEGIAKEVLEKVPKTAFLAMQLARKERSVFHSVQSYYTLSSWRYINLYG
jgi:hypothetical protein